MARARRWRGVTGHQWCDLLDGQSSATADPVAVITAYEMARNRQDVEGALEYFADNAVVNQRNTTFNGKEEIRKYLDTAVSRSRFIIVSERRASGNLVTWTERSSTQVTQTGRLPGYPGPVTTNPANYPAGSARTGTTQSQSAAATTQASAFAVTVEAVIQDGKIQTMSYIFGGPALRQDPSLEGRAELPASMGLGAVLLVLIGVLLIASVGGLGRASPAASSLRGRLMQDLQGWAAARQ